MPKVVYNSHGWVVKSYEWINDDKNYKVSVVRDGVLREVRMYGTKPPNVGETVSLHME
jgi:RNA-splicing ligase RtcB